MLEICVRAFVLAVALSDQVSPPGIPESRTHAGDLRRQAAGSWWIRELTQKPASNTCAPGITTRRQGNSSPATRSSNYPTAYSYVNDNPLNGTDPTGLDCGPTDPGGCINEAAGGLVSAGAWLANGVYNERHILDDVA